MHWLPHEEFTPAASPSAFSVTPPPTEFDVHGNLSYQHVAQQPNAMQWQAQEIAIVNSENMDSLGFHPSAEYVDPNAHLQGFYGVEPFATAPNCGIEAAEYTGFHEELTYNHHSTEIQNY